MALNAYLKLKGQQQGDIEGSVTQKGREDTIQVFSYSFGAEASEGLPIPGEFMVALDGDQSTAGILNAFVNQETITSCELDLYATNIQGQEILEQKWVLTGGKVASFRGGVVIPSSTGGPVNEVTFTFHLLTYTFTPNARTAEWDLGAH